MSFEDASKKWLFIKWFIGAIGAIAISLASLWATHFLGPHKQVETRCSSFKSFLNEPAKQEIIRQYLGKEKVSLVARQVAVDTVSILLFEQWAADCAEANVPVSYELHPRLLLRITAGAMYHQGSGQESRQCRQMHANIKNGVRWSETTTWVNCLKNGEWQLHVQGDLAWLYGAELMKGAVKSEQR